MIDLGHEITVLASYGYKRNSQPERRWPEVIPFTSRWDFAAFLRLFRLCRREKYDIVNLQYSPALYGTPFKLFYPLVGLACPTVVTLHTLIGGELVNRLVALLFILFCAEIISTNEEITYLIRKHLRWKKDIIQIPIGSNILPPERDGAASKTKKDKLTLTHFGLFYPGKGVETILDAVAELRKEYDDFQLVMLGGEWPGAEDYYHGLQQRAHKLGVDEYVRWMGYLPAGEVSACLSATDIFLIPYDQGISIRRSSYMAGLAYGLPIISTHANIESEYIKEGENIVLVPPKDPLALKEKILELIQDPTRRRELGEKAKRLAAEFHWPNIASRTIQVFERVKC
jgi:glycosyltransferase involved in cell wall biosynthesis